MWVCECVRVWLCACVLVCVCVFICWLFDRDNLSGMEVLIALVWDQWKSRCNCYLFWDGIFTGQCVCVFVCASLCWERWKHPNEEEDNEMFFLSSGISVNVKKWTLCVLCQKSTALTVLTPESQWVLMASVHLSRPPAPGAQTIWGTSRLTLLSKFHFVTLSTWFSGRWYSVHVSGSIKWIEFGTTSPTSADCCTSWACEHLRAWEDVGM